MIMRLETICRNFFNIADDIQIYEILEFCNKYDGYSGEILFLVNFDKRERELINEDDIEDKDKYKVLGFKPVPGLAKKPDYCILYCKVLDSDYNWKYVKIKTNKTTTKTTWAKSRKILRVLTYKN